MTAKSEMLKRIRETAGLVRDKQLDDGKLLAEYNRWRGFYIRSVERSNAESVKTTEVPYIMMAAFRTVAAERGLI